MVPDARTNRITTTVSVWDGSIVVLGGASFEKRQKLNGQVPIVGDMPIVGRSFESKVGLVERANILFFVTVRVIDPAGNRVTAAGDSEPSPDRS
jgi:general secretion pathway protein D